jgi:hypothetical protein
MVMQYWALQEPRLDTAAADAERIDQLLPAPSAKGIPGRLLKQYLEEHGFSAFVFNGEPRDLELHREPRSGMIARCELTGFGPARQRHYTVFMTSGLTITRARLSGSWHEALFLGTDAQFHELSRGLQANRYLANFRPIALLGYPQYRIGLELSRREAPRNALAII